MVFSDEEDLFDDMLAPAPAPVPAPKKTSLFGPSKFARPASKVTDEEQDEAISLFSRRNEVFADVVRQRQETAKRKEREKEREREREKSRRESKETENIRDRKRRRSSREGESESDTERIRSPSRRKSTSTQSTPQKQRTRSISIFDEGNSRRPSSAKNNISKSTVAEEQNPTSSAILISLDSDDDGPPIPKSSTVRPSTLEDEDGDEDDAVKQPKKMISIPEPEEDAAQLSEEEFPELVAAAKARQQEQSMSDRLAAARNKYFSPKTGGSSTSNSPQTSEPDVAAKILVASTIPGTNPLILMRKLSQRLKDVRVAWIEKQNIGGQPIQEPLRSGIFLTWRGVRVFDVTTCKSMGIKIGLDGRLEANGEGFEEGQIYLQAWTQELFDAWKKEKMASRQRRLAGPDGDESEAEPEPTAQEVAAKEAEAAAKFRVILRAKNYEDIKLWVKPKTEFTKLLSVVRRNHNLGTRLVQLFFDGEAIEPNTKVEQAGLEDMDVLEIHM